jgi:hypothetical protein
MTAPRLIGLAGYARVGKDTVGEILVDRYGYERRAFADKLRELAYRCNPILDTTGGYLDGAGAPIPRSFVRYAAELDCGYEWAKGEYPEVRRFLVALGAGARTVLGGDVWLDACLPERAEGGYPGFNAATFMEPTVITDVRYVNEAQRIVDLGGVVIYIARPDIGPANDEEARSITELMGRVSTRVIVNNGSLDALADKVQRLMTELGACA